MREASFRLGAVCVVAAPLTFAAAWWLLTFDQQRGPTPSWRTAHLLFLLGLALMLGAASLLYSLARDARGAFAAPALAIVLIGALGLAGNFALDLAAARIALSQTEMDQFFSAMAGDPLIRALFYTVLPFAFYAGLLVQLFVVRAHPAIPRWAPLPVTLGIAILGVERVLQVPALAVVAHAVMVPGFAAVAFAQAATPDAASGRAPCRARRRSG